MRRTSRESLSSTPGFSIAVAAQVEDDVILTLNHIVIYQEESELLENRR